MDLNRLDELLASHDRLAVKVKKRYPEAEPALIPKELLAAARAYRDLANGKRVVRHCESHGQLATKAGESCAWAILADALHTGAGQPPRYVKGCRIVSKLLVDPPTEETR